MAQVIGTIRVLTTIFMLFVTVVPAAKAADGGMVSSGGELIKDGNNPWWIKNTPQVRYCLEIDQKSISATPAKIEEMTSRALEFWRGELTRRLKLVRFKEQYNAVFNQLGVGHQQFVRVPCTGTEELRFKFGAGTLEPARRAVIPNLRAHVGIAIRTEYDEVNLRGRGFIYIASDIGNETYDASNSIAQPWKHEIFLFLTLVHELGHVFGIPHTGPKYSLMSAQFLEMILHKTTAEPMKNFKIGESNVVPFFFFPSRYFVQCSQDGWLAEAVQVFQIPADTGCLHFGVDDDRGLIHVYGSKKPGAPEKPLGLISKLDFDAEPSLGVTLFLTPKQKVFAQMPNPYHLMTGPFFAAKKGSASFTPAGGGPARPLYLDLSPSTFTIVGLANGTLKTLLTGPMTMIPHY